VAEQRLGKNLDHLGEKHRPVYPHSPLGRTISMRTLLLLAAIMAFGKS
jgi:hypothetical protein